jgi:hypothetical protein
VRTGVIHCRPRRDSSSASLSCSHSVAPDRVVEAGPTCDSWAQSPEGVTCDASMPATSYPLSIFTQTVPNGTTGTPYSDPVVVGGGRPRSTYALVGRRSLPLRLRLDRATGLISGTPRVAGTYAFTVRVTDSTASAPLSATQPLSATVAP